MSSAMPPTFIPAFHNLDSMSQIEYQQLGNTDMVVSKMTFGGTAIGNIYRNTDDEESHKVVEKALRSGLNLIDTAPWYGQGSSEVALGKVFQNIPRKSYYLTTKVGRYEQAPDKMFDFRAERVIQSVDESLQRLGVEYVDVIQVHDMEFAPSLNMIIDETLPALQKVKDSGKARYIGITGYPMENFRTIIEESRVKIDTILTYCHGSMNDNSLCDYLPYFQSKSVGVINASILSMGLLTNRGPSSWHPANDTIRGECKRAAEYCQSKNVDISRIATHYSLQLPGIDTTLIGTASLKNLETNIDVMKKGISAHEKLVADEVMEKFFKPLNNANWEGVEVEKYWNKIRKLKSGLEA